MLSGYLCKYVLDGAHGKLAEVGLSLQWDQKFGGRLPFDLIIGMRTMHSSNQIDLFTSLLLNPIDLL